MISIKSYFNWNKLFMFLAVALYWFWRVLSRSTITLRLNNFLLMLLIHGKVLLQSRELH